jgi:hypothetical protein
MQKIVALIFLSVHLFSFGGYQLLFKQAEHQQGKNFIAQLDQQSFNENDLIEIKVPIELPYMQNWDDYERYDGEVIIEGVHYNYVKRKLVNDSMSFLCIPNVEKNRLYNARETFFAMVNDIEKNDGKKNPPSSPVKVVKLAIVDYTEPVSAFQFVLPEVKSNPHATVYLFSLSSPFLLDIEHPPATLC